MKPLPFTCIFSVLERAGCTPLSALHRYFPEYSARANSSLKEPFPRTIGSSTPPSEVSVLPLQIKISYFEIEILLIIKQYFFYVLPENLVQYIVGAGWPLASQLIVNELFNKTAASEGSICQYGGTTEKNTN